VMSNVSGSAKRSGSRFAAPIRAITRSPRLSVVPCNASSVATRLPVYCTGLS
jgi:hypothetical protein